MSLIQRAVIHSDSIEVVECQNEDRKQSLINQILYQRDSYLQKAKRYFFELRKDDGRLKDDAYPLVRGSMFILFALDLHITSVLL